jgi:hypothetical protein
MKTMSAVSIALPFRAPEASQRHDKDQAVEGHLQCMQPSADGKDSNLLPVTNTLGFRGACPAAKRGWARLRVCPYY